jgi:short-subunit dehydrogenase
MFEPTVTHSPSPFVLQYGPWALVTGASDGIGRAIAQEAAQRGLHVVLVARRQTELERLAAELSQAHGVLTRVLVVDLGTPEGVASVQQGCADLDVGLVVCAAGFGTSGPFLGNALETELDMLQVNCAALTAISWTLGQRLVARGRGGLVLLSSLVAFQGVARTAHYAATKAYVQTLAEGLQQEWASAGVQVLAVAPGPVGTGFARRSGMAMGQTDTPEVVARQSLNALPGGGTLRPGTLGKVLGYGLACAPRWARVRILGQVMSGMTRQR